jgi:hypothetical protein
MLGCCSVQRRSDEPSESEIKAEQFARLRDTALFDVLSLAQA